MRLIDVATQDGTWVNPDYVVKVVPEGTECWLYLSWGDRLWCNMSAKEVAKALQGEPTKEQLAAMYEESAKLMSVQRDMLRHPTARQDFDSLKQRIQERQEAPFMSYSFKIKPDQASRGYEYEVEPVVGHGQERCEPHWRNQGDD